MYSDVTKNRTVGSFIGLAIGDALGASVEFMPRDSFEPVSGMRSGGPWQLEAGQWTDDTIMALCLAESLINRRSLDHDDVMKKWVAWYRDGYNSPKGYCFDIGGTTASSLSYYENQGSPVNGTNPRAGGNGSIMRLAPAAIFGRRSADLAMSISRAQGFLTHNSKDADDCCAILAVCLYRALNGFDPFIPDGGDDLGPRAAEIARGSYMDKSRASIRSGGYCIDTLEAALWACYNTASFSDAVLAAVNLGDDADSVGAVAGQLAGAMYGLSGIPVKWVEQLYRNVDLINIAEELHEVSKTTDV
jgi:ADP-ribosyl-[dinitrogen reductase] hydrolase